MSERVIIVGGGYTGLAAALDLRRAGKDVLVLEAEDSVGGLAGSFEVSPGYRVEKFYHHWFSSDEAILSLLRELGLGSKIRYLSSNTGLYYANSIFRLASPLDLLKFTPLPFIDRVRTGLMALAARRISRWEPLEDRTTEEWILSHAGRRSYEVIWEPLLKGKFGIEASNISAVWFWNKLKLRGSSRDKKGAETLVYFEGGFGGVTDALREALEKEGVAIRTSCPVARITTKAGKVTGVITQNGEEKAGTVLVTTPLPTFLEMAPDLPETYSGPASQIRFLGNVCLVLRLNRSLSSTYWLNVADPTFPFVGIIEHTNFDPPENYGGEVIAYLSKYLPISEAMFSMSEEEVYNFCIPYIRKIFPDFSADWVNGYRVWRAKYSQPVITKRYSELIPTSRTPIKGLWLSTMAQIYPEDRGTNYAVRHGRETAREILKS